MRTGRRKPGRGARRNPGGQTVRRQEREKSTAAPVVPTERVEEPAQSCPGGSAPACSDQILASKQQKANRATKRVANIPLDSQQRHKRKTAKELHVKSPSPLHEASPVAFGDIAGSITSSPVISVTGDIGSDIDEEDQQADDIGVDFPAPAGTPTVATDNPAVQPTNFDQALLDEIDRLNEFEIRKTYRLCNFN